MFEGMKKLVEAKQKYDDMIKEEGKQAITEALKDLFDKNPDVSAVRWTQYTPYFNDGEPCCFGVNEVEVLLNCSDKPTKTNEEDDDDENDGEWLDSYSLVPDKKYQKEKYDELKNSGNFDKMAKLDADLGELNESFQTCMDALEACFGDHVRVVVTRKEVKVTRYDHD